MACWTGHGATFPSLPIGYTKFPSIIVISSSSSFEQDVVLHVFLISITFVSIPSLIFDENLSIC